MNKKKITKEKAYEELQIKDDFMFSVIMRNPKFCKPFLERVKDGKNTVYDIEMQTTANRNIPKRARYYQGMIDLNILEKGEDYKELKRSFVIFVCTFDLFGEGRHIYTFENRCIQNPDLGLGDDTTKIILNTKGTMDDVTPEMRMLLDYIDGQEPEDDFTKELDEAVKAAKKSEKWRLDYMTLQMRDREKIEEGRKENAIQTATKMIKAGKLSKEEIADYSGLTLEEVTELERELSK